MAYNDYFLERYANEKLAEARHFVERERLAQPAKRGRRLHWVIVGLAVIGLGLMARML
jgi:hypothetical protein